MNKKGTTLLEVVVAMSIFAVVAVIAVDAFVSVSKTRALSGNMRESQQKIRIAMETFSRLAKNAEMAKPSSNVVELYFDTDSKPKAARFIISGNKLYFEKCIPNDPLVPIIAGNCESNGTWEIENDSTNFFGGSLSVDPPSAFSYSFDEINGPTLTFNLHATLSGVSPFYSDDMKLKNTVILESLK